MRHLLFSACFALFHSLCCKCDVPLSANAVNMHCRSRSILSFPGCMCFIVSMTRRPGLSWRHVSYPYSSVVAPTPPAHSRCRGQNTHHQHQRRRRRSSSTMSTAVLVESAQHGRHICGIQGEDDQAQEVRGLIAYLTQGFESAYEGKNDTRRT